MIIANSKRSRSVLSGVADKCAKLESADDTFELLNRYFSGARSGYTVALNAEKIIRCVDDDEFSKLVFGASILVPDGVAACWTVSRYTSSKVARIEFPKLAVEYARSKNLKVSLVGTTESRNRSAVNSLRETYPGLEVVSSVDGFQSDQALIDHIANSTADILLLGLGSPKQESVASRAMRNIEHDKLIVCCGGYIDILSGEKRKAPKVFQDLGLEWMYRLITNPQRFGRYLKLTKFIYYYWIS
jgi:exopolysaccharide biosynthesis WecB/TagA/CpsF family protein